MSKSTLAKVFAWGQLVVVCAEQVISASGIPHTVNGWLALAGSFLAALAIHHASNTSGQS